MVLLHSHETEQKIQNDLEEIKKDTKQDRKTRRKYFVITIVSSAFFFILGTFFHF